MPINEYKPSYDVIDITRALIRCESITPNHSGTLDFIESLLQPLGFDCERLIFGDSNEEAVHNIYAKLGSGSPHLCFAGHVDVVPSGPLDLWQHEPFSAHIDKDIIYGRGAVDMKGAIAAFICALKDFLENPIQGSISLLITSDEEGIAINGTDKVIGWLQDKGDRFDHCMIGEPSSQNILGDTIKIGRRGSMNTKLTINGIQGHVAYPDLSDNPAHRAVQLFNYLISNMPQKQSAYFDKNSLQITSIDVGNNTVNLIPSKVECKFNIRFNDQISSIELQNYIESVCDKFCNIYTTEYQVSGEADLCCDQTFIEMTRKSIEVASGVKAEISTIGGTSDGRFICRMAPVIELGLLCKTMHQANERVSINDLKNLKVIYSQILKDYYLDKKHLNTNIKDI
jgi:succinyl-diaminopimelate desuccinylase